MKPHPRHAELRNWAETQRAAAGRVDGTLFRVAGPRHATAADIVSGVGGLHAHGRWSHEGVMRIVYLATEPETAMSEAMAHYRYYRLPKWKAMPKVTVAVRVSVGGVVDLTDATTQAGLPVAMGDVMAEDWRALSGRGDESLAQTIGRAAFAAGLGGLYVPSNASPGGVNLIVFPDRVAVGDALEVLNPADLAGLGRPT
jgi:RES domain-containing protein